jgi:hypothetical protein
MLLQKTPSDKADRPPRKPTTLDAVTSLNTLDLEGELLTQYKTAKRMLEEVEGEDEVGLNQKAQMLNTIGSILANIVKTQAELHNIERLKVIEATLIEVLKRHETVREAFLADYEKAIKDLK